MAMAGHGVALGGGHEWYTIGTAQWSLLARHARQRRYYYPPYQTCHHRFQQWVRSGVFKQVLEALATDLKERGGLDLSKCYIDGTPS
ncbi:MAG TPA: hypothetical protein VNI77_12385 [Nitrososphaera sp.]|nr:hypothetical protein [Nitrososphaera sp.]